MVGGSVFFFSAPLCFRRKPSRAASRTSESPEAVTKRQRSDAAAVAVPESGMAGAEMKNAQSHFATLATCQRDLARGQREKGFGSRELVIELSAGYDCLCQSDTLAELSVSYYIS